ncbi:MAG: response regulator transcription factor [Gemmatimonadota bacterium]|nr:MAG: response regulator transcription factor [Gemmatimonadota bacterium]
MDRIRVVIVDDEPPARFKLRTFLEDDTRVEIVGEAGEGLEAVKVIEEQKPDLVFLDVQMPELDGFEVLEALDLDHLPRIIFVTAYDAYAVRAFQVHALDYLLKPLDRERFETAMRRAAEALKVADEKQGERARETAAELRARQGPLQRFLVRSRGRLWFARTDQIDWIEAAGNYVTLHVGDETHLVRGTLKDIAERLDGDRFARIHRSTVVNLESVRELQEWSHGDWLVIMKNGTELRLSRRYRDRLPGTLGG